MILRLCLYPPALPLTRCAGKVVTMSGGLDVLQMKEEDVLKFLAAGTHLGGTNLDFQMEQYVYKRKSDGKWLSICVGCIKLQSLTGLCASHCILITVYSSL